MKKLLNKFNIVLISAFLFGNVVVFVLPKISVAEAATAKPAVVPKTITETKVGDQQGVFPMTASAATTPTEPAKEDTGVIGLFGLNWKLFLAQLVNFAIVLFVLWRWVFKPVVAGMEARTKKIEDSLNTADKVNKDREEFDQWKAKEMVNARHEATAIIALAKKDASVTKDQILEQAKKEQQALLEQSQQQLEQQKQRTLEEAKSSIADLVIESTEKLLRAKLDGKTDAKLIQTVLGETDKELSNAK